MPSTTSYKRGDVVLVPFPFTDLTGAITSQVPAQLKADEFLIPAAELALGGLPKPSIVRLLKLVSLHQGLIVRRIGHWPEPMTAKILEQIGKLL